jgi:hypothetical protein
MQGIGVYSPSTGKLSILEEFLPQSRGSRISSGTKASFFSSFFDCEPKVRFDFAVIFSSKYSYFKEILALKKVNADALGYMPPVSKNKNNNSITQTPSLPDSGRYASRPPPFPGALFPVMSGMFFAVANMFSAMSGMFFIVENMFFAMPKKLRLLMEKAGDKL